MRRSTYALLALSLVLIHGGSAYGAPKPIKPKIGDCYLYAQSEVQLPSSKKSPTNCKNLHNVETYRVSNKAFKKDPSNETQINLSIQAAAICEAGVINSKFFNGWGFKVPTKSEWKSGARWLRCEAFVAKNESETVIYDSWKGKKLDFK